MVSKALQDALTRVPTGMAARLLDIDPRTLYPMRDRGDITCEVTASGRFLWNVAEYLARKAKAA